MELLANHAQYTDVDIHDRNPGTELLQDADTGTAYRTGTDDQRMDAGSTTEAIDKFSFAAIAGQEAVQAHHSANFASRFTVW